MIKIMYPVLDYPYRSPLKVAEALKDIIKDKVVCDVGCACGDLMVEFSKYANKVIGIECDKEKSEIAKKRGFQVVDIVPNADVYYVWIGIDSSSEDVMNQLKTKKGKLILAEEDIQDKLGGYRINIPIDDISKIDSNNRKIWHLQVLEL